LLPDEDTKGELKLPVKENSAHIGQSRPDSGLDLSPFSGKHPAGARAGCSLARWASAHSLSLSLPLSLSLSIWLSVSRALSLSLSLSRALSLSLSHALSLSRSLFLLRLRALSLLRLTRKDRL